MIEVTHISKRYGHHTVVDDVTFDVAPGRVTGFVGPNGAGKSTTMRTMVGLTRPDAGEVRYFGTAYTDLPHPARVVGAVLDARSMHPAAPPTTTCGQRPRSATSRSTRWTGHSTPSGSPAQPTNERAGSLSACDSDWPWPSLCSANPTCCCSTNPPTGWTLTGSVGCAPTSGPSPIRAAPCSCRAT